MTGTPIDPQKLAAAIAARCGMDAEASDAFRHDQFFVDSKGLLWQVWQADVMSERHKVFAIFALDGEAEAIVFAVPAAVPKGTMDFRRYAIQKHPGAGSKAACVGSSMKQEAFEKEIGEMLWVAWYAADSRTTIRESAETFEAALREIATAGDLEAAKTLATDALRAARALEDDEDPPAPPGDKTTPEDGVH